jgi:O-antigen/teichoic acid export membrane protein
MIALAFSQSPDAARGWLLTNRDAGPLHGEKILLKKLKPDLLVVLLLLLLPLMFFWPVTLGGKTLLPVDNLFAFEPWASFANEWGVSIPHNELLSDLILENYVWKRFIVQAIHNRQIPLWNPYLFAGLPFLAAGQHSALYPLSILFYILPLARAHGFFTALQFSLAGLFTFIYCRVIGVNRFGALIAGITYMLSAFFVVSVVFTMIIAAAAWLPLLLTMIEIVVRKQEEKGPVAYSPIPYIAVGAVALGLQLLAGHVEISLYVLLVMSFYALCRLAILWWRQRNGWVVFRLAFWLVVMVVLGLGLGAVQFIPLYEVARLNFRQGSVPYTQVVSWAFPPRRLIAFLVPDFFGNPSHHNYLDVFTWRTVQLALNAHGQLNPNGPHSTNWGVKNYVEGGSYLGLLPLLLVTVATISHLQRNRRKTTAAVISADTTLRPHVWLYIILIAFSLAFIFGTPLYAILFYTFPGINQLHSPFRWVFPYTLSVAVLAGIGADHLARTRTPALGDEDSGRRPPPRWLRWLCLQSKASVITVTAGLAFWGGLTAFAALLLSRVFYAQIAPIVERTFWSLAKASEAFPNAQAFYSYELCNLLLFSSLLTASAIVLRVSRCPIYLPQRLGRRPVWEPLALAVLVLDLFAFGYGFNPRTDPKLFQFKPPVVDFLQQDQELYRFTTFVGPGEKTFNANVGMYYGLYDVRGYDSIFPKQYADYMSLIEEQDELLYNRIAPLSEYPSLDSRLLDLLNVKYVLTTQHIPNPGYRLVYDEEIKVYENEDYLPRAFVVPKAKVVTDAEQRAEELKHFNPLEYVLFEEEVEGIEGKGQEVEAPPHSSITGYTINEVLIDVEMAGEGWLVLADSYFPGWKAYGRPLGAGESEEMQVPIYRANGNFRAVHLPGGAHTVRFKYAPRSLQLGLFVSFIAGVVTCLLAANWLWGRFYRESDEDSVVKRVAKNSLTPMTLSLLNKGIDFAFAMLRLRILAPMGEGRYAFAIGFIGYFEILTIFGLGTLLTREVAKDRGQANHYLNNTVVLRVMLWLAALPLIGLGILLYTRFGGLTHDTATAIVLFTLGLFFGNVADALSTTFNAYEKMEYPAIISTVTTVLKVSLGAGVLLLGWGFVGLAGVSVIGNLFTAAVLFALVLRHCFRPRLGTDIDFGFQRQMLGISFPLMINHLLATIFFRIDILLLKPLKGDTVVGYYGAALKYIDGLIVIPSFFTIAIFPLMSRYAASARESLLRAYILSLRLLLMLALPVAVGTPFIARELILILGGREYLPHSMIALQLLIGFFPLSCINQVTQYVLIALDQQRFLTKAFMIGVAFNLIANLVFIPRYSYQAAAAIAVLSEIALLIPFYYCVRRNLASIPWLSIVWRPALASAFMGTVMRLLQGLNVLLLIPSAAVIYFVALIAVGAFSGEEMELLKQLLPLGSRRAETQ